MENIGVLREWFDRVDSDHTGNVAAPQLQVHLLSPQNPNSSPSWSISLFVALTLKSIVSLIPAEIVAEGARRGKPQFPSHRRPADDKVFLSSLPLLLPIDSF